jgi:hypothetical protein
LSGIMADAGATPNSYKITSESRGVEFYPRPSVGEKSKLVIRFEVTENHSWVGIGLSPERSCRTSMLRKVSVHVCNSYNEFLRHANG